MKNNFTYLMRGMAFVAGLLFVGNLRAADYFWVGGSGEWAILAVNSPIDSDPIPSINNCGGDFCLNFNAVTLSLSGNIHNENNNGIDMVTVSISGATNGYTATVFTGSSGDYVFNNLPGNDTYTICAEKTDNPLNGCSTYDLLLMHKHIVHIQPLDSPYKIIAADVTEPDIDISVADMLILRKLILGIYSEFPEVDSWRFVAADFVFSNPNEPQIFPYVESCKTVNVTGNTTGVDFIGVKSGDVNGNAVTN